MASDDPIRASDTDREAVVAALRDAYAEGRLAPEEFDERVADAYAGRTWGDLRRLTADLPAGPVFGAGVPGRPEPPGSAPDPPARRPGLPPPGRPGRRGNPVGILVPVAIWTLIAVNGGASHGFDALILIVTVIAVLAAIINRLLPAGSP